jgi:hypothetical protein
VYSVVYSTDLINWTAVTLPNQALLTSAASGALQFLGNGIIAWCAGSYTGSTDNHVYTSTNLGVTWTANQYNAAYDFPIAMSAYGNSTTPLVIFAANGTAAAAGIWVGTSGGALTKVTVLYSAGTLITWTGVINGYVIALDASGYIYSALQTSNLALAASWSSTSVPASQSYPCHGMTYFNGKWIVATGHGIYTSPGPTLTSSNVWTLQSAASCRHMATNGTIAVAAIYGSPGIATSTDGVTWTNIPVATNLLATPDQVINLIYDGTRFVATTVGTAYGMILTSTDGLHWSALYTVEQYESTTNTAISLMGLYGVSATVPASGTFTYSAILGFILGAISAGTRVVNLSINGVSTALATVSNTSTNGYNYFEVQAQSAGGTVTNPIFNVMVFMNGQQIGSVMSETFFSGSSLIVWNLPRNGSFTTLDDMYLLLFGGPTNAAGAMGPINIVETALASDAQAQFTKDGSEASNSAAVSGTSLNNTPGYVTSSTVGNKDIYTTAGGFPSTPVVVKAMMVEAFMSSSAADSVEVGLVSNGVETDQTPVALTTTAYVYSNKIVELDPKTNVGWTLAGANAAKAAITKTA